MKRTGSIVLLLTSVLLILSAFAIVLDGEDAAVSAAFADAAARDAAIAHLRDELAELAAVSA